MAAALGVWAMAFLAVTLVGCSLLLGRKLGALFRVLKNDISGPRITSPCESGS